MTRRKADIIRPDKRIGVRIETLAYLFDVSPQTVENAVAAGKIKPSSEIFGVKLYHVESVERAIFGLGPANEPLVSDEDGQEKPDPITAHMLAEIERRRRAPAR